MSKDICTTCWDKTTFQVGTILGSRTGLQPVHCRNYSIEGANVSVVVGVEVRYVEEDNKIYWCHI